MAFDKSSMVSRALKEGQFAFANYNILRREYIKRGLTENSEGLLAPQEAARSELHAGAVKWFSEHSPPPDLPTRGKKGPCEY
jgi:hypothetical protein